MRQRILPSRKAPRILRLSAILLGAFFLLWFGSVFCNPAWAYFQNGSLIQVVYKSDDVEVGTDLLDLLTFNLGQQNVALTPAGTFNLGQFVTTNNWADLRVGLFAFDGTYAYFATTQNTAPEVVSRSWLAFLAAAEGVQNYYSELGTTRTVIGLPSEFRSYWVKMNSATTPGQYAGLNGSHAVGESTLAALSGVPGYVDMYLYKFQRINRDVFLVPGSGTPYIAVIRLLADGSTRLNPQVAPVAPVIAPIPDGSTPAGTPYTGPTPTLSQGTLPVTWSLVTGPSGMTINASTGVVSWPNPTTAGSPHTVTIRATNAAGSDDETWLLTVTPAAPSAPTLHSPPNGSEVTTRTPVLSVQNASFSGGGSLTYDFEVYSNPGLTSLAASATGVAEGTTLTQWQVSPALSDNTTFYWRSRACAGGVCSSWMSTASFFVNTENDPPSVPSLSAPPDGSSVAETRPILQVTNATDPDLDELTYEFQVYSNSAGTNLVTSATGISQGTGGTTSWQVDTDLQTGNSYWWRAQARDSEGVASGWSVLWTFTVTATGNRAPSAPTVASPPNASQVSTLRPTLTVANATDPDGDPLTYFFEVDRVNTFDSANLQRSPAVSQGSGGTTSWQPSTLTDNTTHFWRARASDGEAFGPWATASFFVNLENDPPSVPTIREPDDGGEVQSLTPTLRVYASTDVDSEAIFYEFELYADEEMTELLDSTVTDATSWTVGVTLQDGATYFWRVRALDDQGEAGNGASEWTALVSFVVNVGGPPLPPTLSSPIRGATVTTRTPTLTVANSPFSSGGDLEVEFELYANSGLSTLVDSSVEEGGDETTSWTVGTVLNDNATYYWRARARRGDVTSSWTATGVFTVKTAGPATAVEIVASKLVEASSDTTEVLEVTASDSPIRGVAVRIPPGALPQDATITIGVVTNPPPLPSKVKGLGRVVVFGPEGMVFNESVTLVFPYTESDLQEAGVTDPADLSLYTYDPFAAVWKKISVSLVDEENKVLLCEVDHFSMFTKTAAVSGGGGGGGGGGCSGCCFIASAVHGDEGSSRSGVGEWRWKGLLLVLGTTLLVNGWLGRRKRAEFS